MISVIIPALNEEEALPETLAALHRQPGIFETILVDGGSSDRTWHIAARWPSVRVVCAARGRAWQMNAGAARATGEWLVFLHADTILPANALLSIEGLDEGIGCGGFRHRFSGDAWSLRFISCLDNLRARWTHIIYGDQAMFVRRALFEELGGFPQQRILEDIAFCTRLQRVTRPVLIDDAVATNSRKFRQMGVWRSLARCAVILFCVEFHLPIPRFALVFFRDIR